MQNSKYAHELRTKTNLAEGQVEGQVDTPAGRPAIQQK